MRKILSVVLALLLIVSPMSSFALSIDNVSGQSAMTGHEMSHDQTMTSDMAKGCHEQLVEKQTCDNCKVDNCGDTCTDHGCTDCSVVALLQPAISSTSDFHETYFMADAVRSMSVLSRSRFRPPIT